MATYAIGDIQGCYDPLMQLLDQIRFSDNDQLWIAGDLVNRGPKSLDTLRFLESLGSRARIVLGNHDLHLLAVHYNTDRLRRSDTLDEILAAPDRDALMDWLRHQPLVIVDPELQYAMVHAGIPPQWDFDQALSLSREVETVLQGPKAASYFEHMYGNEPERWSDDLTGWGRLRVITNYFTRMRFCDAQGTLELKSKGGIESQPAGFQPWFHHPRAAAQYPILFGHWAALEGYASDDRVFALDTGCVWGNKLTALRLEDQMMFNCDCPAIRPINTKS